MFCSICGNELPAHLNYCNHCGARNAKNMQEKGSPPSGLLVAGGATIGCVGLVVSIGILKVLLESRLDTSAVVLIVLAYLAALVLMFGAFMGFLWKGSGHARGKYNDIAEPQFYAPPASLRPVNTSQLESPRGEPAVSVTEHTTRTLDEVLIERK
jgi:hypothetical protein